MAKITAKGKLYGENITIICEDVNDEIKVEFNSKENEFLETKFKQLLKETPAIGGTYYPDENSMLNAYNVLENTFFETLISIDVDGEIDEIPFEDGVIY